MSELVNTRREIPPPDGPRRFRSSLDQLARQESDLEQAVQQALSTDAVEPRTLATLLAKQSSIANRRLTLLTQWVSALDRRIGELGADSETHSGQIVEHEQALRMVCDMLKDMDDPYGFGLSLDERIAGNGSDPFAD
ncbi:hypothetical protein ACYOEI_03985 [Singulisphaera rosea]